MHERPSYDWPAVEDLWKVALGLLIAVAVTYGASAGHGFVSLDDASLVTGNTMVKSGFTAASLVKIFTSYDPELYIPLTFLSYKTEYALFGLHAGVFHVTNILLHAMNAVLVYLLFFLLTKRGALAIAIALLFALHPVNAEAVNWVSARKDLLSSFFALGTMLSYLRYRSTQERAWYAAGIALFLLALLSKVSIVLLPLALLLIDVRDKRNIDRRMFLEKAPHAALSIVFIAIALYGKSSQIESTTLVETALMAGKSVVFYLRTFFWPSGLGAIYPYNGTISFFSPDFLAPAAIVFLLLIIIACSLRFTREIIFGAGFFLLFLLPSFTNFYKGGALYVASDRYVYLAYIGLFYLTVAAVLFLIETWGREKQRHSRLQSVSVLFGVLCLFFGYLSSVQSRVWADSETLYENTLRRYPDSFHAQHNLGAFLVNYRERYDEAREHFRKALELRPGYAPILTNLGIVAARQGMREEAIAYQTQAIESRPDFIDPYYNLGSLYLRERDLKEAKQWYEEAIRVQPDHVKSLINLGAIASQEADTDGAIAYYERAIAADETVPEPHYNLGIIYERIGRLVEAESEYRNAIDIQPAYVDAHLHLGGIEFNRNNVREAVSHFEEALKYDPENVEAREILSKIQGF